MKNIFKFFGALLTVVLTVALTGCTVKEDLESAEVGLHIKVFFPTKVVAGQPMTINGSGFAEATSVVFPGEVEVTDIEIVSNDMIRVNAPAGIAAEGGTITVRTPEGDAVSPLPLTVGKTVISGYSVTEGQEVEGGSQMKIYGTDLEFIKSVELLDADGNPALVEDKTFVRKSTDNIIFMVPKKVYEGTFAGKVHTIDGLTFDMPELAFKPAADGGYWETVKNVIWENPDPATVGAVSWSGQYRFGLEGTDGNNECITTFPAETWDIIKNGTFYVLYSAPEAYQIRVNTGWWSFDSAGEHDIHPGNELVTDNGDGTFSLKVTISEEPLKSGIYDLIDQQHLLLTGNGYTPLQIYTNEEVWVEGGGSIEIVRTAFWKNPDPATVGAVSWSGQYRFGLEGTDGNNECITTFPAETWDIIKNGTFYVLYSASEAYQIRVNTGWWSFDSAGEHDIHPGNELVTDNGDGTFSLKVTISEEPLKSGIYDLIDQQHLLLTGNGYTPLELYIEEEVFVPGGGDTPKEVVIWENDGSVGASNWDNTYRFGMEGGDPNNECVATIAPELWALLKTPFKLQVAPTADWWQIRILTGWWGAQWPVADNSGESDVNVNWTDIVVDNGDGTFTVSLDFTGHELCDAMDQQHLLFVGSGFQILKIYQ